MTTVTIQYVAYLREAAGKAEETRTTSAATLAELYDEVAADHGFTWPRAVLRVAVGNDIRAWTDPPVAGGRVLFLPPAAGG